MVATDAHTQSGPGLNGPPEPEPSRLREAWCSVRFQNLWNTPQASWTRVVLLFFAVATMGPWLNADLALRCADISLDLGDVSGALDHAQVASDALQGYPDAGTLPARLQRLQARIKRGQEYGLTPAELRLVTFLRTHLSLQDIADRLHLARLTVKTHVASIYGKLGVTCRSDAVEIVEQAGLESTDAKVTIPRPELDRRRDAESPLADDAIPAILSDADRPA